MKWGKEVQAFGIKEGGERVADVIRIITQFKSESTVSGVSSTLYIIEHAVAGGMPHEARATFNFGPLRDKIKKLCLKIFFL